MEDSPDRFEWASSSGTPRKRFIFSDTWTMVKETKPDVSWYSQVWFSGSIPKNSFIMWICCWDRMPTLSRLRNWGIVEDDTCPLCENYCESRDHLLIFKTLVLVPFNFFIVWLVAVLYRKYLTVYDHIFPTKLMYTYSY